MKNFVCELLEVYYTSLLLVNLSECAKFIGNSVDTITDNPSKLALYALKKFTQPIPKP